MWYVMQTLTSTVTMMVMNGNNRSFSEWVFITILAFLTLSSRCSRYSSEGRVKCSPARLFTTWRAAVENENQSRASWRLLSVMGRIKRHQERGRRIAPGRWRWAGRQRVWLRSACSSHILFDFSCWKYLYFSDAETKTQGNAVSCPQSQGEHLCSWESNPGLVDLALLCSSCFLSSPECLVSRIFWHFSI